MDAILAFLQRVVDPTQAQWLGITIGLNVVLGVLAAIKTGQFQVAKLVDFWKRVALVGGAYMTVAVAATLLVDFVAARTVAWLALEGMLAAKLVQNLSDLGLPIPAGFLKFMGGPPTPPNIPGTPPVPHP